MKFKKKEYIVIGFIILTFLISTYVLPLAPEQIPSHWDSAGQPNAYSHKIYVLYLLPIIIAGLYTIFTYIPFIAVYKKNLVKFSKQYFRFKTAFIAFLIALHIAMIIQIFYPFPMNYFILPAISALFFLTSYVLKHSKRNFFIGFRTPWAMSSEENWKKTNHAASKFFAIYAGIILLGLIFQSIIIWILIIPLIFGFIYIFRYSFKEFKKDYPKGI